MDIRPIGVFDSGLGGLTAVREIRRQLPSESIIYFGDTARVPYGGRSRETLLSYARQDLHFLQKFDLKAVVIACGTVSTTVADTLRQENTMPIIDVVGPTCTRAVESTKNGTIGLIATAASIHSGAYERIIHTMDPNVRVISKACPLFVPLVENGRIEPGDPVIETVVREYLTSLKEEGVDTLILGCTHYPLLKEVIGAFMGNDVVLVDSGAEAAHRLGEYLKENDLLSQREEGEYKYYVSDRVEDFATMGRLFLHQPLITAEQVDILQE